MPITSCTRWCQNSILYTKVQIEISNFDWKMGIIWGGQVCSNPLTPNPLPSIFSIPSKKGSSYRASRLEAFCVRRGTARKCHGAVFWRPRSGPLSWLWPAVGVKTNGGSGGNSNTPEPAGRARVVRPAARASPWWAWCATPISAKPSGCREHGRRIAGPHRQDRACSSRTSTRTRALPRRRIRR